MFVTGSVASTTVQMRVAGVGSMLPFTSTACTRKVWLPSVSSQLSPEAFGSVPTGQSGGMFSAVSGIMTGGRHWLRASPSRKHSNSDPCSVEVKEKAAVLLLVVPLGPARIVVSGGFPTVQPYSAGVSPAMPYSLTARTWNRYSPSGRLLYVCGEVQATKSYCWSGFGVSRHSNVALGSVEENVNVWLVPALGSAGAESIVGSSGGAMTLHV